MVYYELETVTRFSHGFRAVVSYDKSVEKSPWSAVSPKRKCVQFHRKNDRLFILPTILLPTIKVAIVIVYTVPQNKKQKKTPESIKFIGLNYNYDVMVEFLQQLCCTLTKCRGSKKKSSCGKSIQCILFV